MTFQSQKNSVVQDQRLWTALRNNEQYALEELFRKYNRQLYNYGIKINPDAELVKDAIQQLFLNLWKHRNFLAEAQSVKAYLLSSLRRLILQRIKRDTSRATRNRNYINHHEEISFSVEEIIIRHELAEEKVQALQKVLNELSPRQKEAIFLKFYHGLTNPEIVEVMQINNQCVRNLIYDALQRLRSSISVISYQI